MNNHLYRYRATASLFAVVLTSFSLPRAHAEIEPGARALAKSMTEKIGAAQTIRPTAKHKLDPALGVGAKHEKGPIEMTVKRPNKFYALQQAGEETRELAFDGRTFCLMHPELKHHAMVPLSANSIEQFADRVDERLGFRPPVAELLAGDPSSQLFRHVTSAKVIGRESVGWTRCDRLHFIPTSPP